MDDPPRIVYSTADGVAEGPEVAMAATHVIDDDGRGQDPRVAALIRCAVKRQVLYCWHGIERT